MRGMQTHPTEKLDGFMHGQLIVLNGLCLSASRVAPPFSHIGGPLYFDPALSVIVTHHPRPYAKAAPIPHLAARPTQEALQRYTALLDRARASQLALRMSASENPDLHHELADLVLSIEIHAPYTCLHVPPLSPDCAQIKLYALATLLIDQCERRLGPT
jgi:hypothetical protein